MKQFNVLQLTVLGALLAAQSVRAMDVDVSDLQEATNEVVVVTPVNPVDPVRGGFLTTVKSGASKVGQALAHGGNKIQAKLDIWAHKASHATKDAAVVVTNKTVEVANTVANKVAENPYIALGMGGMAVGATMTQMYQNGTFGTVGRKAKSVGSKLASSTYGALKYGTGFTRQDTKSTVAKRMGTDLVLAGLGSGAMYAAYNGAQKALANKDVIVDGARSALEKVKNVDTKAVMTAVGATVAGGLGLYGIKYAYNKLFAKKAQLALPAPDDQDEDQILPELVNQVVEPVVNTYTIALNAMNQVLEAEVAQLSQDKPAALSKFGPHGCFVSKIVPGLKTLTPEEQEAIKGLAASVYNWYKEALLVRQNGLTEELQNRLDTLRATIATLINQ
ncbi:hypothetical protein KG892_04395 [Vermiphilus pyriformis]|nr:MAG: hypothetical protein KG892_04395 [Vermiphilus pyriformis]